MATPNETVEIPLDVAVRLRESIVAYLAGDPVDDEEWHQMGDHLDTIHEIMESLLSTLPQSSVDV
jgi:hypothetical protein